jgi:hypothetical protein
MDVFMGSIYLPGWVFMFPETDSKLLGKLTRNPESFKPFLGVTVLMLGPQSLYEMPGAYVRVCDGYSE